MQNSKKPQTIFLQQKIEINFYFPYFVAEVSHMAQQIAINYCNFKKKKKKNKIKLKTTFMNMKTTWLGDLIFFLLNKLQKMFFLSRLCKRYVNVWCNYPPLFFFLFFFQKTFQKKKT
jgi:ABC-type amino acid transport system permease subunit